MAASSVAREDVLNSDGLRPGRGGVFEGLEGESVGGAKVAARDLVHGVEGFGGKQGRLPTDGLEPVSDVVSGFGAVEQAQGGSRIGRR